MTFSAVRRGEGEDGKFAAESPGRIRGLPSTSVSANAGYAPSHKLILQVGPDVIGYQDKAHGMAVDSEDNVWISAANSATVMKISQEGKLLLTLGERARRGDWDEAKGQRLL